MSDLEQQFERWLDGKLSPSQQREFEQQCEQHPEMAARMQAARAFMHQASHTEQQPVPNWNREATFEAAYVTPSRWQWQSGLSMAMSFVAICMVLFKVDIQVTDGSFTVSFAGKQQEQRIAQLVNERVDAYEQQQQLAMKDLSQQLFDQQKETNAQLSNYLITANREERREDFVELIKYINDQRSDDQLYYAKQLNDLQQDLYQRPANRPAQ